MDMASRVACSHPLPASLRQINRLTGRRPWTSSRKLGSGHEVRVKDYFYYGERPHDEDPDDDEEFPEEKDYDKYRALKRYTEYATPEHWETIKKNLGDESAVWRKQGYPINNDDLNEDVKEVIVRRSRRKGSEPGAPILEQSIDMEPMTALTSDTVNIEESKYWCSEEPEGKPAGYVKLKKIKGKRMKPADSRHPGDNRIPMSELKPGQEYKGVITEIWLVHGVKIDIGAEYDALVYVSDDEWPNPVLSEKLVPGLEVKVRIYKVLAEVFRWPIHCELLEPNLMHLISPPSEWPTPIDWRRKSFRETLKLSGRRDEAPKVMLPLTEDEITGNAAKEWGAVKEKKLDPETQKKNLKQYEEDMAYNADRLVEQIKSFDTWGYSSF